MKQIITVLIVQMAVLSLSAQVVYKKGQILNREEWSGTIKVDGNIEIAGNGNLVIKPGTYIEFQNDYNITVKENGRIEALGTTNDSIFFTSTDRLNGWNGIRFKAMLNSADSSRFSFCNFSYAITNEDKTGGAITVHKFNKLSITDTKFDKNTAEPTNYGGAIYGDSADIKIVNCQFTNNYSSHGGALSFRTSAPLIKNSSFINNKAYHHASAIYYYSCNINLCDCVFNGNYIGNTGGEVIYIDSSTGKILNVDIRNNFNCPIYCYLSDLYIINALIANNIAPTAGGIEVMSCRPTIINSTVVNNFGNKTGGVSNSYSEAKIINSIIWGNKGRNDNLSIEGGYYPSIINSNLTIGKELLIPTESFVNNIAEFPSFVNPCDAVGTGANSLTADWTLRPCSPCIDKGNNGLLSGIVDADLKNAPRIFNQIVDIGAYEVQENRTSDLGNKILYVSSTGNGSGESWADAMGNLQNAINYPKGCYKRIEIWLKKGTYLPETIGLADPRSASFKLNNQVAIYGGFKGNETSLDQRDFNKNETILSGDIGKVDDMTDNAYSVVKAEKLDSTSRLDGISIMNGRAAGGFLSLAYENGAGLYLSYADVTIRNCKIIKNFAHSNGGGIYAYHSKPTINNTLIADNYGFSGGGVYFIDSDASFNSSKITNNTSYHFDGGGIYMHSSDSHISNSIIANNQATGSFGDGGGVYCSYSNLYVVNSLLVNNYSINEGGGIYVLGNNHVSFTNCIVWNNQNSKGFDHVYLKSANINIENCIVQGGNTFSAKKFVNNIDKLPRFIKPSLKSGYDIDALSANWGIFSCSPAINSGTVSANGIPDFDIAGNKRIFDNIDIGPYEFIGSPTEILQSNKTVFVDANSNGDGSSWGSAMNNLQDAINLSCGCYQRNEIWVAKGLYVPNTVGLDNKRLATINLRNNTEIYGGFSGSEKLRDERNWRENATIISGDIGQPGSSIDNSYHVLTCENIDSTSVLAGFIVSNGNANGDFDQAKGGGIYVFNSTNILSNIEIRNNYADDYGGGLYVSNSKMDLAKLLVSDNVSGYSGGGLLFDYSELSILNCEFRNNDADSRSGAIGSNESISKIVNCVIANNRADEGAAIVLYGLDSKIINSTIVNNKAIFAHAGGFIAGGNLTIENSIVWGNENSVGENQGKIYGVSTVQIFNSNIQGGNAFNLAANRYVNNIDTLPGFVNPISAIGLSDISDQANWRIHGCSPCINKGLNNSNVGYTQDDFDGNIRIFNDTVDIGAFEVQHVKRNFPSDISLSDNTAYKYAQPLSLIGTFSTIDKDENDSFKYQITKSYSGYVNYFTVTNDSLLNMIDFSNSWSTNYSIEVKVTDKYNCWLNKSFGIEIDTVRVIPTDTSKIGSDFLIYPNPVKDRIFIEAKNKDVSTIDIKIYSLTGELIETVTSKQERVHEIMLDFIDKGAYVFVVSSSENREKVVIKVLKE